MPIQQVNNVKFNYELMGKESILPPLVFIGGYASNINFWRPVAEYFAQERQVLIFDNQGAGKTQDAGEPLTVSDMAANTNALIEKLHLFQVIVSGFAFGGCIAQQLAHDYPQNFSKMILLASTMKLNKVAKEICEQLCVCREQNNLAGYSDIIYDSCFGVNYKSKVAKKTFQDSFVPELRDLQTAVNQRRQVEAFKAFDATFWEKEIKVPTVAMIPKEDLFATPQEGSDLVNAINSGGGDAQLLIIESSSHSVLIEQVELIKAMFKEQIRR